MRYMSDDELTQVMGLGYPGEVRMGPDGLYQWVEGVDGLGNVHGFWKALKKATSRLVRRVAPIAQQFAPLIPGGAAVATGMRLLRRPGVRRFLRRTLPVARRFAPMIPGYGPAVATGLRVATPYLRRAGVAGNNSLGALYEAPDGDLYEVQGLAEDEEMFYGIAQEEDLYGLAEDDELYGLAEDELSEMMGMGYLGQVRAGPDGSLYQWVEGVDGLGNPVGFWKALKKVAKAALPFVPGGAAVSTGLNVMRALRGRRRPRRRRPPRAYRHPRPRRWVAGYDGLGALYEAPDGYLYEVQGLSEDADLYGLAEDEDLYGFGEDEDLYGLAEDEDLHGFGEDEDLYGFAEDEELYGLAEDEELYDLDGYIQKEGVSGMDAYVPVKPTGDRKFVPPAQPPEMWKPLW